ncbi:MAG: hypothetical protein KIT24_12635 [Phycisphaeraceae bacterium]|nr:hypothetical protein [Phycisphaeraceae bacterium]
MIATQNPLTALLPRLAANRYDLLRLLEAGVPLEDIIALAEDPEAIQHLENLAKLALIGLTLRAAEARSVVIDTLSEIARDDPDPKERRRAAAYLLRATAQPLISRAGPSPKNAPHPDSEPALRPSRAAPSPIVTPNPDITPEKLSEIILTCARDPDTPERQSGIATIAAFLTPTARIRGQSISSLAPLQPSDASEAPVRTINLQVLRNALAPIRACEAAHADHPERTNDNVIQGRYRCALRGRNYLLTFTLERQTSGPHPECWMIASIHAGPPVTTF